LRNIRRSEYKIIRGIPMYEIRIHGRGGQGVKMSAHVLGRGAFLSGFEVQDFAVYGAERRGAPLASFVRISKDPIETRGYIFNPDFIIVLDPTLDPEIVSRGLKVNGIMLINSEKRSKGFKGNVKCINATEIALKTLGKPIPNIAILGAFLRLTNLFSLKNLKRAIRIELEEAGHGELVDKNIKACEMCWKNIK
jgi:pyruvate ferredoxin oxidoreductase gamma subunit